MFWIGLIIGLIIGASLGILTLSLCIANKNIPNMVGQITSVLASEKMNISAMVNQNRNDVAYNLIDVETQATDAVIAKLKEIEGIISVRAIQG